MSQFGFCPECTDEDVLYYFPLDCEYRCGECHGAWLPDEALLHEVEEGVEVFDTRYHY